MKEKILRLVELNRMIDQRYYDYAWCAQDPSKDAELSSWIKERDSIIKNLGEEH